MAFRDVQDIIINDRQSIGAFLEIAGVPLATKAQDIIVEILNEGSGLFSQQTVTVTKSNIDGFYKLNTISLSSIIGNEGVYAISLGGTAIDNVFLGRFRSVARGSVDQVNDRNQEFNDDVLQNIDRLSTNLEGSIKESSEKISQIQEMVDERLNIIDDKIDTLNESGQKIGR